MKKRSSGGRESRDPVRGMAARSSPPGEPSPLQGPLPPQVLSDCSGEISHDPTRICRDSVSHALAAAPRPTEAVPSPRDAERPAANNRPRSGLRYGGSQRHFFEICCFYHDDCCLCAHWMKRLFRALCSLFSLSSFQKEKTTGNQEVVMNVSRCETCYKESTTCLFSSRNNRLLKNWRRWSSVLLTAGGRRLRPLLPAVIWDRYWLLPGGRCWLPPFGAASRCPGLLLAAGGHRT